MERVARLVLEERAVPYFDIFASSDDAMLASNDAADFDWKRVDFGHDACCDAIVPFVLFPTRSVEIARFFVQ